MGLRKEVLGEKHPDTHASMANLASTYWQRERLNNADKLEGQVVDLSEEVLGKSHPDTLIAIKNLAITNLSEGRDEEAGNSRDNVERYN